MADYRVQSVIPVFDGVTLTSNYADNRATFPVGGMSKLSLDIDYAQGASETGNILEFTIEHSPNGTDWYSLVIDDTSTVSDITPREWNVTGDNTVNVLLDIAYKNVRISAKESGVAANAGTLSMTAVVSGF